ncbi:hypothetical protein AAZX31_08G242900 [Glycine max]
MCTALSHSISILTPFTISHSHCLLIPFSHSSFLLLPLFFSYSLLNYNGGGRVFPLQVNSFLLPYCSFLPSNAYGFFFHLCLDPFISLFTSSSSSSSSSLLNYNGRSSVFIYAEKVEEHIKAAIFISKNPRVQTRWKNTLKLPFSSQKLHDYRRVFIYAEKVE